MSEHTVRPLGPESQASVAVNTTRVAGTVLCAAAILIALISNNTYQWAIGVPVVLALLGVGLRIEAAVQHSRSRSN